MRARRVRVVSGCSGDVTARVWCGWGFLERSQVLEDELETAAIDDVIIDVDDLSPKEVAHEVLTAVGW